MKNNIIINLATKIFTLALIVLIPVLVSCSSSNVVAASDIKNIGLKVNCVCDTCDLVVSNCDCETAKGQIAMITKGLSRGQSEEQIIRDLVVQYGQRVLIK